MYKSFLLYGNAIFLWISLTVSGIAIGVYLWHTPVGVPRGDTWLGYTLGTIAALLIVWLMAFGIRKRQYGNTSDTVQAWLSAHVYAGIALIVLATLHCGFQFGWNIHTLAYVLMIAVVLSGLVGVYGYVRYPARMTANRKGLTREEMLEQIAEIDRQCLLIVQELSPRLHGAVASAIEGTRVGGGVFSQLLNLDQSTMLIDEGGRQRQVRNREQSRLSNLIATEMANSRSAELNAALQSILGLFSTRLIVLRRLRRDIRWRAMLEIWLYAHVPLSFALLAALIAHIVSVFVYW